MENIKLINLNVNNYYTKPLKQPLFINNDLAWFIGLVYFKGVKDNSYIFIENSKKKYLDKISNILYLNFGFKNICHINIMNNNKKHIIIISKFLNDWLIMNKLIKSCENEDLPILIRKNSDEIIDSFLYSKSS